MLLVELSKTKENNNIFNRIILTYDASYVLYNFIMIHFLLIIKYLKNEKLGL